MGVYPAQATPVEVMSFQKTQDFLLSCNSSLGQGSQVVENLIAVAKRPAGQFPHNEGMAEYLIAFQQRPQALGAPPKMFYPHRGVHQNHAEPPERRLGTVRRRRSVPPSAASRRALSREINASRPSRTSLVFCVTPVSSAARRRTTSSIFRVVRICISMHHSCIQDKSCLFPLPGK